MRYKVGLSGSSEAPIPDWAVLEYLHELGEIAVAGEDIRDQPTDLAVGDRTPCDAPT
jgi:hypothetical protein